jgi:hypothetical protein
MAKYDDLIEACKNLQSEADRLGIRNIYRPGLARELVIAQALGHEVLAEGGGADAKDSEGNLYEYLHAKDQVSRNKGKDWSGKKDPMAFSQFSQTGMTKKNYKGRITRNKSYIFAIFYGHLTLVEAIEVSSEKVLSYAQNTYIPTTTKPTALSIDLQWVREEGKTIYKVDGFLMLDNGIAIPNFTDKFKDFVPLEMNIF